MEDTILTQITRSKTIGDLAQRIHCSEFFIYYLDKSNKKHMFKTYYAGQYLPGEYERFLKCDKLSKINLLDDFYDIFIQYNGFENECYLRVIAR